MFLYRTIIERFKKIVYTVYIAYIEYIVYIYKIDKRCIIMVSSDDKSERIKLYILKKLDKINTDRRKSYSDRIALLLDYCDLDKEKFNLWLNKMEGENGRK